MASMDTENISVKNENMAKQENNTQHLSEATPKSGTKRPRTFGTEAFTEQEERIIRQKLDVGLSRAETQQRPGPGGVRLTYIEGWKVIHDANQIFGFNGWSSSIVSVDIRYTEELHGRHSVCVSAGVRVTLRDGSSREDRGGGVAENMRSKGEAIIKAEKEAVTDATKRALKNFGLRLGLSLYDRQHLREMNRPQPSAQPQNLSAGRQQQAPQPQSRPHPAQQAQHFQSHVQQQRNAVIAAAAAAQGVPAPPPTDSPVTATPMDRALAAHVAVKREEAKARQRALQKSRQNALHQNVMQNNVSLAVSSGQNCTGMPMPPQNIQQPHSMKPTTSGNHQNDAFVSHGLANGVAPTNAVGNVSVGFDGQASSRTHSRPQSSSYNGAGLSNGENMHAARLRQQEIEELSAIALADF